MDSNDPDVKNEIDSSEAEIENIVDCIVEDDECKNFNFLINASNQASITSTYNSAHAQINALFVMIQPYYIENLNIEELNVNIHMGEKGRILVNGKEFDVLEVQPGIKVFGIVKKSEE